MTLRSMTGFGRAEGSRDGASWAFELRSVNGKGLDIRVRMPSDFEALDQAIRKEAQARLGRGNVSVALSLQHVEGGTVPVLNEAALEAVLDAVARTHAKMQTLGLTPQPVDATRLLALRGVMDLAEPAPDGQAKAALEAALFDSYKKALEDLRTARAGEGAQLQTVLSSLLDKVAALTEQAAAQVDVQTDALRARISAQVTALVDSRGDLSEDRLMQELALIAAKADIREELDRLAVHVAAMRALLTKDTPVGRQLDFLSQELTRESNTLVAKSTSSALKQTGLDLKLLADQIREQVQNVE